MPGWALITMILSTFLSAACAAVAWKRASECYPLRKRVRDLERTTADLNSDLESLLESHKRLRSREGMRELREKRSRKTTPQHESKSELLERLGMAGKTGPAFAAAQLALNAHDSD